MTPAASQPGPSAPDTVEQARAEQDSAANRSESESTH
jgi:hypothetical protein